MILIFPNPQNDFPAFRKNRTEVHSMSNLNELKRYYYQICTANYIDNGMAKKEIMKHMSKDGYLIVMHGDNIFYYLEKDKINQIISDLAEEEEVISVMKERLKIK